MEPEFQLGDGIIGRVALSHEPIHLRPPASEEVGNFQIRTVVGSVLPASLYDMPLIRGDELFGVLAVGSIYPMSEKAQNVLNVVVSTLSTMLNNTRAYQHIQDQAQELAARSHEQELLNDELRQQRDELTSLNSALAEANRARSQFLSTMSHELRTPLASIMLSRLFTDDDQREEIIPALIRKAATTFQLSYKLGANYLFSYWQLHRCACCADRWYVLWRIGSC
jgi:signal transduction histidine kinase